MPTRMWTCLWSRGDTCAVRGKWGWQDHAHEHFVWHLPGGQRKSVLKANMWNLSRRGRRLPGNRHGAPAFFLVKKMTVLDNVMLGLKGQGIVADRKSAREKLTGLAATYGLLVNPEAPVHTLSVGRAAEGGDSKGPVPGCKPVDSGRAYRRAHPRKRRISSGVLKTAAG